MNKTKQKQRGRPVLTDKQKAERKELKELFQEHSVEALNTVVSIMRNCLDSSNRLKASQYILNKVTPQTYIDETENIPQEIYINLVSKPPVKDVLSFEEQESLIKQVEENNLYNDDYDDWNTDTSDLSNDNEDAWETSIYEG